MVSPTYRLKIKKIPLPNGIQYKEPHFPAFKELHLDLLENKTKLKKNPPKPLFVRRKDPPWLSPRKPSKDFETLTTDKDDLTLEELEKKYIHNNDHSSDSDSGNDSDRDRKHRSSERSDKDRKHSSDHSSDDDDVDKKHGSGGGSGKKDDRDAKTSSASAGSSSAAPDKYKQEDFDKQAEEEESEEEREQKEKAKLLFKYAVLRKKYPNAVIPEFTEHSDMATMKRVYDQLMQKVSLDSNVETYKQYLQGGFMVMELVCTRLLNINMSGFARQQTQSMNRYEQLLVELGEKHYSTAGSRFPVELRLVFLIVFNAGLFYVQKMLFSGGGPTNGGGGGGGGVMDFIGSMFGGGSSGNGGNDNTASPTTTTNTPSQRIVPNQSSAIRKTMSGPTITPKEVETYTSVPSAPAMPMPTSKPMPMPTSSASMRPTAAAATPKAAPSKPMATPKPAVTMASSSKKSDGHSSSSDFD